jgi:hypothetical protein
VTSGTRLDPRFHRIGDAVGRRRLRVRAADRERASESDYAENYFHRINSTAGSGVDIKIITTDLSNDARLQRGPVPGHP